MKYKAKPSYLAIDDTKNFNSLMSASTHLLLKDGLEIEWKKRKTNSNLLPTERKEY